MNFMGLLMKPKEIVLLKESDREVRSFIAKLRAVGSLEVDVDGERVVVELRKMKVSENAREALARGGPQSDE